MTGQPPRWPVISALGIVQILNWGSSFYLLAVLADPVARETGWPLALVIGGLTLGLLAAGAISPVVGTVIGRHGGRPVLAVAALVFASGLATLGLAPNLPGVLAGWLLIGIGMGCGLYDPAFATIARLYGASARPSITTLTLWGGFASTVCWPLSAFLVSHIGWRGTCLAYAGLHLAVSLPLLVTLVPRAPAAPLRGAGGTGSVVLVSPAERRAFRLMAGVLVLGGAILALVSVHLVALLQARGVALASAVTYGALIGPAQVAARLVEISAKGRHHPLWTLTLALGLSCLGLITLALGWPAVGVSLVLYGAGNGIYSIARGTVPLALFGPDRYAPLVGRLARPSLVAQALAPPLGAWLLTHGGSDLLYGLLVGLGLANLALVAGLWRVKAKLASDA